MLRSYENTLVVHYSWNIFLEKFYWYFSLRLFLSKKKKVQPYMQKIIWWKMKCNFWNFMTSVFHDLPSLCVKLSLEFFISFSHFLVLSSSSRLKVWPFLGAFLFESEFSMTILVDENRWHFARHTTKHICQIVRRRLLLIQNNTLLVRIEEKTSFYDRCEISTCPISRCPVLVNKKKRRNIFAF